MFPDIDGSDGTKFRGRVCCVKILVSRALEKQVWTFGLMIDHRNRVLNDFGENLGTLGDT